jgi:hypothetical protein
VAPVGSKKTLPAIFSKLSSTSPELYVVGPLLVDGVVSSSLHEETAIATNAIMNKEYNLFFI